MHIVGPAGNYEKMEAAIKAGADEVYLGLKGFGARRNNDNFVLQDLFDGIDYAHKKGVKVLLALNTVMKDMEIRSVLKNFKEIYEHGVDAVIVQDFGLIKILKKNFPDLVIHGSTQMTVSNHVEANFLKELGLSRVVLARELSFEEIKSIREKTDIELEVFVSGSLCISYSGNCYVSSFIGGRSGNRGMCAYTCRKSFKDEDNNINYFLSPNDQMLKYEEITKLKEIGINAIKVEGRKKQSEYVFETVSYYRDVINDIKRESNTYKLFNRGYSKGYFYLDNNLMNYKYSSNFGYLIAQVDNKNINLLDDLELGDGIQFVDKYFKNISGTFVNKIICNNKKINFAKKGMNVNIGDIPSNTKYIYKNYSKNINDEINLRLKEIKRYLNVNAKLYAKYEEKIILEYSVFNNFNKKISYKIEGDILTEKALKNITIDDIKQKISELGEYEIKLENTDIEYDGIAYIQYSKLKALKREAIENLIKKLLDSYKKEKVDLINYEFDKERRITQPIFSALVRTKEQEDICRKMGIEKIYREGFDIVKEKNIGNKVIDENSNIVYNLYSLVNSNKKGLKNQALNWNFNIFNNISLDFYSSFENIETIFLSPELNHKQLKIINNKNIKTGLVIYGHLKSMYIEHKISDKKYKEIQGEFYDRYIVRKNELNNTELYLYKPMNLIPKLDLIYSLNFDELRLDFTFENEEEIIKIIKSLKTKKGKYNPYAFEMGVS